jgi:arginine/lysine/ornithine decarboxylase
MGVDSMPTDHLLRVPFREGEDDPRHTPLADALLRTATADMASLHALPLSGGHSIQGSSLADRYQALYGHNYLLAETSSAAPVLDSFFRPTSCLARAQRMAARAFSADATFFISGGTTLSNEIALTALLSSLDRPPGRGDIPTLRVRALVDRTSHQSIHFALDRLGVEVSYTDAVQCCDLHRRTWCDVADLTSRFCHAASSDTPFDLVVLSAGTYDGALLDMPKVLTALLRKTNSLTLLVDEAWSAIRTFHPRSAPFTALSAAQQIRREHPMKRLRMVVTHSAHKSMSALRQASYLHVLGDPALVRSTRCALFRLHTTSPSWPILASLDLARAQAEIEGEDLLERAVTLGEHLRDVLRGAHPDVFQLTEPIGTSDPWLVADRTRIMFDVGPTVAPAGKLRLRLARDFGLYIARSAGPGLLVNLHIGVTPAVVDRLIRALGEIETAALESIALDSLPAPDEDGDTSLIERNFLIAYPPGIPLSVPGNSLAPVPEERLRALRHEGIEVFTV